MERTRQVEQTGGYLPPQALGETSRMQARLHRAQAKNLPLPPPPLPSEILTTVSNYNDNPPDTHGAVGRTQIVTALNGGLWVHPRNQTGSTYVNWNSFFQSVLPTGYGPFTKLFDPRALYDAQNQRYVVVLAQSNTNIANTVGNLQGSLLVAASVGDDATGTWHIYRIPLHDGDNYWVDFPNLGQNDNQLVVTINSAQTVIAAPGTPPRTQVLMLDKAPLYSGASNLNISLFNLDPFAYGLYYPAVLSDADNSMILMTSKEMYGNQDFHFHRIRRLAGPGSWAVMDIGISSFSSPVSAAHPLPVRTPQLGLANTLFTCATAHTHVEHGNAVWFAAAARFDRTSYSLPGVQWAQVLPDTAQVVQSGTATGPGQDHAAICNSIALNSEGDVLIGVSDSAADRYLSSAYFFRAHNDPVGQLRELHSYAAGQSQRGSPTLPVVRTGDYSHTMLDPLNQKDFWTVQERASTTASSAITWAKIKRSGVDLRATFQAGCAAGAACPVVLHNVGDDPAPAGAEVRFLITPNGKTGTASIDVSAASGWTCDIRKPADVTCIKTSAFAPETESVFSYTYQAGTSSADLGVTVSTSAVDIKPDNNTVSRQLNATF